jgi:hypothetical protein
MATFSFISFITLLLLLLAALNSFTKMDCVTICKLLWGTLAGTEVNIVDKEAESTKTSLRSRKKNTDTELEISNIVEDEDDTEGKLR